MELLVRIVDKISDSVYLDAKCTKRGDVIAIFPDGHQWGKSEISNPDWVIISVPDLTDAQRDSLLALEIGDPLKDKLLRKRAISLNLDSDINSTLTSDKIMSMIVVKEKLADPNTIGPSEGVIG